MKNILVSIIRKKIYWFLFIFYYKNTSFLLYRILMKAFRILNHKFFNYFFSATRTQIVQFWRPLPKISINITFIFYSCVLILFCKVLPCPSPLFSIKNIIIMYQWKKIIYFPIANKKANQAATIANHLKPQLIINYYSLGFLGALCCSGEWNIDSHYSSFAYFHF